MLIMYISTSVCFYASITKDDNIYAFTGDMRMIVQFSM
jgi:hypothetical protein